MASGSTASTAQRRRPGSHERRQRLAPEQLHHEKRPALIVLADVVHVEDPGMSNPTRGLRFEEEPLRDGSLAGDLGGEDLDRKLLVNAEMERAIGGAPPPTPQLFVEPILGRENLADSAWFPHFTWISRVPHRGSFAAQTCNNRRCTAFH